MPGPDPGHSGTGGTVASVPESVETVASTIASSTIASASVSLPPASSVVGVMASGGAASSKTGSGLTTEFPPSSETPGIESVRPAMGFLFVEHATKSTAINATNCFFMQVLQVDGGEL